MARNVVGASLNPFESNYQLSQIRAQEDFERQQYRQQQQLRQELQKQVQPQINERLEMRQRDLDATDARIAELQAKDKELSKRLQEGGLSRSERRGLLGEGDRIGAELTRLYRGRNKLVRKLKIAKGQQVSEKKDSKVIPTAIQRGFSDAVERAKKARPKNNILNNIEAPKNAIGRTETGGFILADGTIVEPIGQTSDGQIVASQKTSPFITSSQLPRSRNKVNVPSPDNSTVPASPSQRAVLGPAPERNFFEQGFDNLRAGFNEFKDNFLLKPQTKLFAYTENGQVKYKEFNFRASQNLNTPTQIAGYASRPLAELALVGWGGSSSAVGQTTRLVRNTPNILRTGLNYGRQAVQRTAQVTPTPVVNSVKFVRTGLGTINRLPERAILSGAEKILPQTVARSRAFLSGSGKINKISRVGLRTTSTALSTTATNYGLIQGSSGIYGVFNPNRDLLSREAQINARLAKNQEIGKIQNGFKRNALGIATDIVPFANTLFYGDVYRENLREQATQQGLVGKDVERFVQANIGQINARNIGATVAILNTEQASEGLGRFNFATLFGNNQPVKNTFARLGLRGLVSTAPAGAVEGSQAEIINAFREQRPIDWKTTGTYAGIGAGTAGVVGGTIIGLTSRKRGQKFLGTLANIADPWEWPGDITRDLIEGTQKRFGIKVLTPTISTSPTNKKEVIIGSKRESKPLFNFKVPTFTSTPTKTLSQTKTPSKTKTFNPLEAFNFNPATTTNVPTTTKTTTETNTFLNVLTPTTTTVVTPSEQFVDTPVTITTTTTVPTTTNVPVFTPAGPLLPPPIFPDFSPGGFGRGTGRRKKSAFINELSASANLLNSFLGTKTFKAPKKPKRSSKTRPEFQVVTNFLGTNPFEQTKRKSKRGKR